MQVEPWFRSGKKVHRTSLQPGVSVGTGEFNPTGNPVMDKFPMVYGRQGSGRGGGVEEMQ